MKRKDAKTKKQKKTSAIDSYFKKPCVSIKCSKNLLAKLMFSTTWSYEWISIRYGFDIRPALDC